MYSTLWKENGAVLQLIDMTVLSGIKKYVVGLIIKTSSDPANMEVR